MADSKAMGIVTHIGVDTVDARRSIQMLKQAISQMNREWRADYHAQIAAGKYTDALKTKYQGLKQVQDALKISTKDLNDALKNSSGEKGSQNYRRATLDLGRMNAQMQKTKGQLTSVNRAMELHSETLRTLTNEERLNRESVDADVEKYNAEGRSVDANKVKLKGYSDELSILQKKREALANATHEYANSAGPHANLMDDNDYVSQLANLHKLDAEIEKVKRDREDSGLSNTIRYNDLYNQSTNKVISSLKQLRGNAEAGRMEYIRLTHNIESEKAALDLQYNKTQQVARANITANDSTGHLSNAFQRENSKLESLNSTYEQHKARIHALGVSYGAMGQHVASAYDHMDDHIQKLNSQSHNFLQTAHALTNASIALGSGFLYGAKQAMGLQNQFNYIKNLLNTSGESYRQADRDVKQMGRDTAQMSMQYGQSQKTIANGYTELVKRGYSGRQALASQKTYLQGAIASGDKYSDVMDTAASTLEAFGMRSKSAGVMTSHTKDVVNQLAYAADATATDFKGIGYGMKMTGATAHSANQSLSETASALGVLSNNGQNATNAGFGLRKVLNSFIGMKEEKSWTKILPQLGLSPKDFEDAEGHFKSLSTMMATLQSHTKKLTDAQRTDIFHQLFGATGQESALILAKNTGKLAQLNKQVAVSQKQDHGKGYAARIANRNMRSTENQIKRLEQAGNELAKDYAEGLNPVFRGLAGSAMKLANVLDKVPTKWKNIIAVGTLVIPVMAGIAYTFATLKKVGAMWTHGIQDMGKAYAWTKGHLLGYTNVQKQATTISEDQQRANKMNDQSIIKVGQDEQGNTKITIQSTNQEKNHTNAIGASNKATQQASKIVDANSKSTDNNTKTVNTNSKTETAATKIKQNNSKIVQNNAKTTDVDTKSSKQNTSANQQNSQATSNNSGSKNTNTSDENKDANATDSDTNELDKNAGAAQKDASSVGTDTNAVKDHTAAEITDSKAGGGSSSGGLGDIGDLGKSGDYVRAADGTLLRRDEDGNLVRATTGDLVKGGLKRTALGLGVTGATDLLTGQGLKGTASDVGDSAIGMGLGAGIGGLLGSIIPGAGTVAGAGYGANVGAAITPFLENTKPVKAFNKDVGRKIAPGFDSAMKHIKHGFGGMLHYMKKSMDANRRAGELNWRHTSKAFNHATKGMSNMSKVATKHIAQDERKAEKSYVQHAGRMTKAQKKYFRGAEKQAVNYDKHRMARSKRMLKAERKDGDITAKDYKKKLASSRKFWNNQIKQDRKAERNLEKASGKGFKARRKALDHFNKQMAKSMSKSYNKQMKMRKYLDNHEGKLDRKAYGKVLRSSRRTCRGAIRAAHREYRGKAAEYKKDLRSGIHHARTMRGISNRTRAGMIRNAYREYNRRMAVARRNANSSISSAERAEGKVRAAANKEASSSVRAAEKGKSSWSTSAGYISSHPIKIKHITIYKTIHEHAGGTLDTQALHLAIGNLPGISKDENAIINDGNGRELVKLPNGQLVLPSGRNVHTFLPKGTSVFNAEDTRKILAILHGGLAMKHHATGTSDTTGYAGFAFGSSDTSGSLGGIGDLSDTAHKTKHSMSNIHDIISNGYTKAIADANDALSGFDDSSDSSWKDVYDRTKKHVKAIHHDTYKRYSDMFDELNDMFTDSNSKTYHHLDTTVRYFKSHYSEIPITSRHSMKLSVEDLNSGIEAIDKALKQFGGNSHVLSMIHYATGTSTPSMTKQLAVLNDATSGPVQEAVVSQSGKVRMPRGRNVVTALDPGDMVLNGSDTLRAIRTGLIPHYAMGHKSLEAMAKLLEKYYKKPSSFSNVLGKMETVTNDDLTKAIDVNERKATKMLMGPWAKAMFDYIHSLISPSVGGGSELLREAEKLAAVAHYHYSEAPGRTGPNHYDCSGLVYAALSHFGIHTAGSTAGPEIYDSGFEHISKADTRPGDLVGNSGHIGIIADNGGHNYYSAFSPSYGIGMHPLNSTWWDGGSFNYRRVPQIARADEAAAKAKSTGGRMMTLVKRELGSRAAKWLLKIGPELSGGANSMSGKGAIEAAWNAFASLGMSPTQIAGALGGAQQESHFDPTIISGDDGVGLFQITPWASGVNVKTWCAKHGLNWKDAGAQAKCYYYTFLKPGGYLGTHGSLYHEAYEAASIEAHSHVDRGLAGDSDFGNRYDGAKYVYGLYEKNKHAGYANGGLSITDKLAHISEGNEPEMVLPLTDRSRAVELMLKSLQYMFGNDLGSKTTNNNKTVYQNQAESEDQRLQDRRFEQELIQSNQNKDKLIKNILNKMTVLIQAVENKPVISKTGIYNANREVMMKKLRLRNFNRGTV